MRINTEAEAVAYCRAMATSSISFDKLQSFAELLCRENERQNLIAKVSVDEIWRRHIADSLQLLEHVPRGTGKWLDTGSGAGFPGLAIAIAAPEQATILVEPRKLRAEWLRGCAGELDLQNVRVEPVRVETVSSTPLAAISARAVAPLGKLLSLASRFSTPDTKWVLPKGRSAGHELAKQPRAVQEMFHVEPSFTGPDAGILVGRGVPTLR